MNKDPFHRIQWVIVLIAILVAIGTVGYIVLEGFTFLDALYMTVITLSTVGYGEVQQLSPLGRVFTTGLILSGVGTLAYGVSQIAEFLIQNKIFLQQRREKAIQKMSGHVIICGYGRIGQKVVERLRERKTSFVVIEINPENIEQLERAGHKFIFGDAREDAVLQKAGIAKAKTLVATLSSDADNVYVVLSARAMNPKLYIVARAGDMVTLHKLEHAGADRVISPYEIGGNYIASAVIRPNVVDFMDVVNETAGDKIESLAIEEIYIPVGSRWNGKALKETDLRTKRNVIVLAMKGENGSVVYNPSSDHVIEPGGTLICIGYVDQLDTLNRDVQAMG